MGLYEARPKVTVSDILVTNDKVGIVFAYSKYNLFLMPCRAQTTLMTKTISVVKLRHVALAGRPAD